MKPPNLFMLLEPFDFKSLQHAYKVFTTESGVWASNFGAVFFSGENEWCSNCGIINYNFAFFLFDGKVKFLSDIFDCLRRKDFFNVYAVAIGVF
jgi:hypothetical protein